MTQDAATVTVPTPLGPGDDDPGSPVRIVAESIVARAPAAPYVAPPIPQALGPGDLVGADDTADFHILTPAAPGPGSTGGQRQIVRIPKAHPVVEEK